MKKGDFLYQQYINILHEELRPAMGCTEPIAMAYAAAKARQVLGSIPHKIRLFVSGNIIKNVKSVVVPNTGGRKGLRTAVAAGLCFGKAEKELNLGACFTDYEGKITEEIPALTGAYLDAERGALKVTDIDPEIYQATLPILGSGVYHLYDYQFFYRNLQKNVQQRIQAYLSGTER